ncbi:phosphoribosylaminoimidazolesuccinocarboxamide synthase [candidate division KSB1 bacterium]|nr:phosphoribosylaminoimidazolesuccinocarboxamide synthase [candidate division KSB1 bacterium]
MLSTSIKEASKVRRGKVRDIYELDDALLIVATDRISAFDVVMPNGIPDKGKVLTQISRFWFEKTAHIIPNHLISTDVTDFPTLFQPYREMLAGRSMLVKRAKPLTVECIVRGYLAGSGWKDYQRTGAVSGIALPKGLMEFSRLEEPLFTPSTKAEVGHDENISVRQMENLIGKEITHKVIESSLEIYRWGRQYAETKGIIIADTKFEFGILDGQLLLIDEVLTPDSSRFWPMASYQPGISPPSYDKQFVRDYLNSLQWDKTPPAPKLPDAIVIKTREKYIEAFEKLTGEIFEKQ